MQVLSFHITDLCNSKCTFCVVASPLYTKDSVDYADIVKFLTDNADKGFDAVNIHGGEATIHPKFIETLALIRRLGYPEVHVQTNGILLADADFAKKVVDQGVTLFIVSLHGHEASVQDALTHSPGGFVKTVRGVQNVKTLGASVRTNTVITRQNMRDLVSITRLACDLGVDHINYSNLHPVGSSMFGLSKTLPKMVELRPSLYDAIAYARSRSRRVTIEGFPYCIAPEFVELQLNRDRRRVLMLMRGEIIEDYDTFMSTQMRSLGVPCTHCSVRDLCGGVYPQYIDYHGWSEFNPLCEEPVPAAR